MDLRSRTGKIGWSSVSVQRNPIYGKEILIPTCICGHSNRSTSTLGNTWEADWGPSYLLTDIGALLSSKTNSETPQIYKSLWQGKLSKHDLKVSSKVRELSQPLHLVTILRVNPPVNNLRLHRGVTLKNNPNNIPAMSLYSFFPLKGHLACKPWVFPHPRKTNSHIFQRSLFPTQGVEGMQSVNVWLLTFFQWAGWIPIPFSHGGTQLL